MTCSVPASMADYDFTPPPAPSMSAAADAMTLQDECLSEIQPSVQAENGPRVWLDVEVDGQPLGRVQARTTPGFRRSRIVGEGLVIALLYSSRGGEETRDEGLSEICHIKSVTDLIQ